MEQAHQDAFDQYSNKNIIYDMDMKQEGTVCEIDLTSTEKQWISLNHTTAYVCKSELPQFAYCICELDHYLKHTEYVSDITDFLKENKIKYKIKDK